MTTAVFDTLKAFSKLEAAGMESGQAKAVVDTLSEAFDDTVATKADLAEVKTELKGDIAALKADIAALRAELKADIAALRAELKGDIATLRAELKGNIATLEQEIAGLKSDFKIFKFLFAPAVILLLLKIAFFS